LLQSKLGKQPQGCDMIWKLVLTKHNNCASLPKGKLGKFIPLEFFLAGFFVLFTFYFIIAIHAFRGIMRLFKS